MRCTLNDKCNSWCLDLDPWLRIIFWAFFEKIQSYKALRLLRIHNMRQQYDHTDFWERHKIFKNTSNDNLHSSLECLNRCWMHRSIFVKLWWCLRFKVYFDFWSFGVCFWRQVWKDFANFDANFHLTNEGKMEIIKCGGCRYKTSWWWSLDCLDPY